MLTQEEKAYIKEIAREAIDDILADHEKRISYMERKVFNGFGSSIGWLKWLVGILYASIISLAFWKIRS